MSSMRMHLRFCLLGLVFAVLATAASAAPTETLTGHLDVVWGDPPAHSDLPAVTELTLVSEAGVAIGLSISPELAARHGGFLSWNGRRVEAHVHPDTGGSPSASGLRKVAALTLLPDLLPGEGDASLLGGVTGSQPWVSLLCKFSDIPAEPENLAYFQGMYANVQGGLDHYWREQSYNAIDVVGSTAIDWLDLPNPQSFYVPDPGNGTGADLSAIFNDCTAAADPFVDFSNSGSGEFVGINLMLNDLLDCCAWGGGRFATLDGVTKVWRTTWNPPWSFAESAIIAHEMGHGFGLPHSNNFDDDGNPYDSPWDVMSAATGYSLSDPTYGSQGKHHTAYHKNLLGWFGPSEVLEVLPGEEVTATIDAMALATTTNFRMARIPIPDTSQWYTVETRDFIGYDGAIPGNVVIISHIDTSRPEDAWAVDVDVPPANYGDNEGTMFRVGETFVDPLAGITISVDFATSDGYEVTIISPGEGIFSDGFESGDTTAWTSTVN